MPRTIKVPKTPISAYDPMRRPSALLRSHMTLLEAEARRKNVPVLSRQPTGEARAAKYIAALTQHLHPREGYQSEPAGSSPEADALLAGLRRTPRTRKQGAGAKRKARGGVKPARGRAKK